MSLPSVSWDELVTGIREAFSSEQVSVDAVKKLMTSYRSSRDDWGKFAKNDPHRYTRNLADEGNGSYNLLVVCWGEGHASSIHDHANSHCFMRVLEGSLQEVLYSWPERSEGRGQPVREMRRTELLAGDVAYIADTIGLHRIENASHTDPAVSLHLYCPPITTCHTYDERTGRQNKCSVSFYSKNGDLCSNYSTCS